MRTACAIALVVCLSSSLGAQELSADEAAIRALIAKESSGTSVPVTAESVFWSGAFTRPSIGKERAPAKSGPGSPANRVPGSQRSEVTVVRIEVARSGDMAWEFSNATLSFQLKDGTTPKFDTSRLRVWRKDAGGQWKVAAHFSQSHGE